MSLSKQFALVFAAFFVTVAIGTFFFYEMTMTLEKDKTVINLAGRQRMLIQKYAKEQMQSLLPLQVRYGTLKTAEVATIQIVEDRKHYTKYIIEKLKSDGIVGIHPNSNYKSINGGVPLPATFVQEVSDKINEKGVYSYDLLSKWSINKKKGLNTDFEKEAFAFLFNKRESVFSRFVVHNSLYSLRYATADIASSSACVNCHNNIEESPKKDFKLGDVMGILVVNIPIGAVSAEISAYYATSTNRDYIKGLVTKTKNVFNATLDALISGGNAPLDINMKDFVILDPTDDPAIKNKLTEIQRLWYSAQEKFYELETAIINSTEYIIVYKAAFNNINNSVAAMNEAVSLYQSRSDRRATLSMLWITGGFLGITLLVMWFCWRLLIYKRILLPIKSLSSGTRLVSEGRLDQEIEVKSRDEIGMLAHNFNTMLYSMREAKVELEKSDWIKTGQSELYEIMQGEHDNTRLGRYIVSYLAEHLNAQVGIIYMVENDNILKVVGSYAYSKPDNRSDTFKFGEGLAGQAALERKTILTTEIPDDYIKIDSGWGKATPRHILIIPLVFTGTVKGVIELGSHNKFTDIHLEFLNSVAKSIAIVFNSVQSHRKSKLEKIS